MSDSKTPAPSALEAKANSLIPHAKNASLLLAWIAGLVFIGALFWFFTQPVRNQFLQKAVNQVLEQSGDSRRLDSSLLTGDSSVLGAWYKVTDAKTRASDGTKAFVFVFVGGGFFFPCTAILSPEGKVKDFIPLSKYGERMMKQLSPGILKIYAGRIEGVRL